MSQTYYDPATFTYGFELEMGDVRKDIILPKELGEWEYSERDIVNTLPPYRGICVDPFGVDPPVGGEFNTRPTRGWQAQVARILEILQLFAEQQGNYPTAPFTTHNHVHVHVPGMIDDVDALKRMIRYVGMNQYDFVNTVYGFHELPGMDQVPSARTYLRQDGGRMIPDWRIDRIAEQSTDFKSFIRNHYTTQDGRPVDRLLRTAINTYCLKHIKTIEFRCFRGSFESLHLASCFRAVEAFIDAALNTGTPWRELYQANRSEYEFPPMTFDLELAIGWKKTKNNVGNESPTGKNRKFYDVL